MQTAVQLKLENLGRRNLPSASPVSPGGPLLGHIGAFDPSTSNKNKAEARRGDSPTMVDLRVPTFSTSAGAPHINLKSNEEKPSNEKSKEGSKSEIEESYEEGEAEELAKKAKERETAELEGVGEASADQAQEAEVDHEVAEPVEASEPELKELSEDKVETPEIKKEELELLFEELGGIEVRDSSEIYGEAETNTPEFEEVVVDDDGWTSAHLPSATYEFEDGDFDIFHGADAELILYGHGNGAEKEVQLREPQDPTEIAFRGIKAVSDMAAFVALTNVPLLDTTATVLDDSARIKAPKVTPRSK